MSARLVHHASRIAIASIAAVALAAGWLVTPGAQAAPVTTNTSSKTSTTDAYLTTLVPTLSVPIGWNGSTSACNAGTVAPAAQQATFQAINFYRSMAGLSPVTENTALSAQAQQAALMMAANKSLSHNPPTTWKCYTPAGANAASHSNIALTGSSATNPGAEAIRMYMNDSDTTNAAAVGHRQWILDPWTVQMGSGSTSSSNSLYVFGGPTNTANLNPVFIPWPSAGYFPYQMTMPISGGSPLTAWSVQSTSADFSRATVAVKKNGQPVTISGQGTTSGYGGGRALVWQMPVPSQPASGAEDAYQVTITGIANTSVSTYSYTVRLYAIPSVTIKNIEISSPVAGHPVTPTITGLNPAGANLSYQWMSWTGAESAQPIPISGATANTYTPAPKDIDQYLGVRVTARAAGYVPVTADNQWWWRVAPQALTKGTATVSGTLMVGKTLKVSTKDWGPAPVAFSYQWYHNGTKISKATASSYTLKAADRGKKISVKVTVSKSGYATQSVTKEASKAVAAGKLTATPKPSISGKTKVGSVLKAKTGTWKPAPVTLTYQWYHDGKKISNATKSSYTLKSADKKKKITVMVTGKKAGYTSVTKTSSKTAKVS